MRRIGRIQAAFLLVLTSLSLSAGPDTLHIDRIGKGIQVDGFPLEWDRSEAYRIRGVAGIRIEAINTPGGLAGVLWYGAVDTCEELTLSFFTVESGNRPDLSFRAVGSTQDDQRYAVSEETEDKVRRITAEWVIPSEMLEARESNEYTVRLHAHNACGDTLPPLILTGTREAAVDEFLLSPMMLIQALAIVILLALYLNLRSRSKRYRR